MWLAIGSTAAQDEDGPDHQDAGGDAEPEAGNQRQCDADETAHDPGELEQRLRTRERRCPDSLGDVALDQRVERELPQHLREAGGQSEEHCRDQAVEQGGDHGDRGVEEEDDDHGDLRSHDLQQRAERDPDAAGLGGGIGIALGSLLKVVRPEVTVVVVLLLDAAVAVVAALLYGLVAAVLLGLTAGLAQMLGKLSLDALIQRDVPERIRTAAFARSETLLQLSWVVGGFIGIALPLIPRLGLGVAAGILVVWTVFVLSSRRTDRQPSESAQ